MTRKIPDRNVYQRKLSVQKVPNNSHEWLQQNEEMRRIQVFANDLADKVDKIGGSSGGGGGETGSGGSITNISAEQELSVEHNGNTVSSKDVKILDFVDDSQDKNIIRLPIQWEINENVYNKTPRKTRAIIGANALIDRAIVDTSQRFTIEKNDEIVQANTVRDLNFILTPHSVVEERQSILLDANITSDTDNPEQVNIEYKAALDVYRLKEDFFSSYKNPVRVQLVVENDDQTVFNYSMSLWGRTEPRASKMIINGLEYTQEEEDYNTQVEQEYDSNGNFIGNNLIIFWHGRFKLKTFYSIFFVM